MEPFVFFNQRCRTRFRNSLSPKFLTGSSTLDLSLSHFVLTSQVHWNMVRKHKKPTILDNHGFRIEMHVRNLPIEWSRHHRYREQRTAHLVWLQFHRSCNLKWNNFYYCRNNRIETSKGTGRVVAPGKLAFTFENRASTNLKYLIFCWETPITFVFSSFSSRCSLLGTWYRLHQLLGSVELFWKSRNERSYAIK